MTEPPTQYRLWLKQEIGTTGHTVGEVFRTAFVHGRSLVEDTDADADVQLPTEVLDVAEKALESPDEYVLLPEDIIHAIAQVVGLGAHYMHNNDYGDDEDFPEDAFASRVLGDSAEWYFYISTDLPSGWRFAAREDEPPEMQVWAAPDQQFAQGVAERVGVDKIVFKYGSRVVRRRQRVDVPGRWGGTRKEWKDVPL